MRIEAKTGVAALLAMALTVTQATQWTELLNVSSVLMADITGYRVRDVDPPPDGGYPVTCPAQWWFNEQYYVEKNGVTYNFFVKLGTKRGYDQVGYAVYVFGDVRASNAAATVVNVRLDAMCDRHFEPDGSSVLMISQVGSVEVSDVIVHPPHRLEAVDVKTTTVQYDEYCLFINYYDVNWHYLYSEEIPGTCWYVETT